MGRNKLDRFADNAKASNVIQDGKPLYTQVKGKWRELYFKNQNPIVLELGCGRGEYTVGLASIFPDKNFIGVDIKGSRLWKGSQIALQEGMGHVAFLRIHIQNLDLFLGEQEVDEIWITFPDPRPRDRDEKRRLTHPRFLRMYQKLLKPQGILHLKTDNTPLYEYSLEVMRGFPVEDLIYTPDLYASSFLPEHHGIQTRYEKRFVEEGFKIKYLRCRWNVIPSHTQTS